MNSLQSSGYVIKTADIYSESNDDSQKKLNECSDVVELESRSLNSDNPLTVVVPKSLLPEIARLQNLQKKHLEGKKNGQVLFNESIVELDQVIADFLKQPLIGTIYLAEILFDRLHANGGDLAILNQCNKDCLRVQSANQWKKLLTLYIKEGNSETEEWAKVFSNYIQLLFSAKKLSVLDIEFTWLEKLRKNKHNEKDLDYLITLLCVLYESHGGVSNENQNRIIVSVLNQILPFDTLSKTTNFRYLQQVFYKVLEVDCNLFLTVLKKITDSCFCYNRIFLSPEVIKDYFEIMINKNKDINFFNGCIETLYHIMMTINESKLFKNCEIDKYQYIEKLTELTFQLLFESRQFSSNANQYTQLMQNGVSMLRLLLISNEDAAEMTQLFESKFSLYFNNSPTIKKRRLKKPVKLNFLDFLLKMKELNLAVFSKLIFDLRYSDNINNHKIKEFIDSLSNLLNTNSDERGNMFKQSYTLYEALYSYIIFHRSKYENKKIISLATEQEYFKGQKPLVRKIPVEQAQKELQIIRELLKYSSNESEISLSEHKDRIYTASFTHLFSILNIFSSELSDDEKRIFAKEIFSLTLAFGVQVNSTPCPFENIYRLTHQLACLYDLHNHCNEVQPDSIVQIYLSASALDVSTTFSLYFQLCVENTNFHDMSILESMISYGSKIKIALPHNIIRRLFVLLEDFSLSSIKKNLMNFIQLVKFSEATFEELVYNIRELMDIVYTCPEDDSKFLLLHLFVECQSKYPEFDVSKFYENEKFQFLVKKCSDSLDYPKLFSDLGFPIFTKQFTQKISLLSYPAVMQAELYQKIESAADNRKEFFKRQLEQLRINFPDEFDYIYSLYNGLESTQESYAEHVQWIDQEKRKFDLILNEAEAPSLTLEEHLLLKVQTIQEQGSTKLTDLSNKYLGHFSSQFQNYESTYNDPSCTVEVLNKEFESLKKRIHVLLNLQKNEFIQIQDEYDKALREVYDTQKRIDLLSQRCREVFNSLTSTLEKSISTCKTITTLWRSQLEGFEKNQKELLNVQVEMERDMGIIFNRAKQDLVGHQDIDESLNQLSERYTEEISRLNPHQGDLGRGERQQIQDLQQKNENQALEIVALKREAARRKKADKQKSRSVFNPSTQQVLESGKVVNPRSVKKKTKPISELWKSLYLKSKNLETCSNTTTANIYVAFSKKLIECKDHPTLTEILGLMDLCGIKDITKSDGSHKQFAFIDDDGNKLANSHSTYSNHEFDLNPEFLRDALRSMEFVLKHHIEKNEFMF